MPPSAFGPRRALLGAVVAVSIVAAGLLLSPTATLASLESLAADPVLFGLVVCGLYLVRPLLAWPTTPLALVVGYGYGVTLGVPVALIGIVVTVVPVYLAARWVTTEADVDAVSALPFGLDTALERTGRSVTRYYETAGPIRGVTASRLAPIPSDIATCAAAASGVSLRHLVVGTVIGELPWTIAAVVVGASAATVTTDGIGELGGLLAIGCTLGAVLLLAGPVYRLARTHNPRTA
ncbi:TVP38/TMEM64 family protein [Natronoglomus mannanivorans]|uniref:VTT domain-containing protein n=1 Tax=Natronoglomus mannanivorans TaxID=2979990 RepID=A0AAP2YWK7_9EURY|nr:VTT domain-containing protein [Halobacteria archaeon AArc-xg1-1]